MDKKDMLRILRLLSAMEIAVVEKCGGPDYMFDQLAEVCEMLEEKILASDLTSSED